MGMRTIAKRIEQAEETLKAKYIFPPECICFPDKEPPFFCEQFEEEIAAQVKSPLHGERFKRQQFFIYVASWAREKEPARRQRLSPQHRKAWDASFPGDLTLSDSWGGQSVFDVFTKSEGTGLDGTRYKDW